MASDCAYNVDTMTQERVQEREKGREERDFLSYVSSSIIFYLSYINTHEWIAYRALWYFMYCLSSNGKNFTQMEICSPDIVEKLKLH